MLDSRTRNAIHELARRGLAVRAIARDMKLSRNTVREVLRSGSEVRPAFEREESLGEHLEQVKVLFKTCRGNLVRVHEELEAAGVVVAYATLTGFCRRHQIGVPEKVPAGRYHFEPGVEMQHDTSPHWVTVGGRERLLQCASVVLAHSCMLFAQAYPSFDRFYCKAFLTVGVRFFGGAAASCMTDNTHVVVAHGTGAKAVIAPEMVAFGERFGFVFVAHELGDTNRSARVERPFGYIENNFYPGRTFTDLDDLNTQLRVWCGKVNQKHRDRLHAAPTTLFVAEMAHLQPLPAWIPEVVRVETRRVDVEGFVSLHTNRYPAPVALIDEAVEVHETLTRVQLLHRHQVVADHPRHEPGARERIPAPERHVPRRRGPDRLPPEEAALVAAGPEFVAMIALLRRHYHGRACLPIRRLHRLFLDYPTDALRGALAHAVAHGQYDPTRVERIVLQRIGGDVFRLPFPKEP